MALGATLSMASAAVRNFLDAIALQVGLVLTAVQLAMTPLGELTVKIIACVAVAKVSVIR